MPDGSAKHPGVARVIAHAAERGVALRVVRFAASTRTAQDAAGAIGTGVERIVKSLVFRAGDETLVVLCSGAMRVDETRLASAVGVSAVRRATPEEVKAATGAAIGGVPPFGHASACRVVCDPALLAYDQVWAAAGLHDAVFPISPGDLVRLSGANVQDVAV